MKKKIFVAISQKIMRKAFKIIDRYIIISKHLDLSDRALDIAYIRYFKRFAESVGFKYGAKLNV